MIEPNITSAEFKANPFPFYAWLRDQAPVYRVKLPKGQAWLLARYNDVLGAVKDDRFVKDEKNIPSKKRAGGIAWRPEFIKVVELNMLGQDEPNHARLRGLVHKAFTPRLLEDLRPKIEQITRDLLEVAQRKGTVDLIHDLALPLPVTVISDMLGVPPEDRGKFHQWSSVMLASSAGGTLASLSMIPAMRNFLQYIRGLIQLRRRQPQDDLTSALVQASESGDRLTEDELVAMIFLLLVAGHETTVNLIGNGTLALLDHPDQLALLRRDPELIKSAVEEMLRFTSPVEMADERYARETLTVQGVTIPQGDLVYAVIASANRDEAQFSNPDSFDITRDPNRHLAFSQGIHYCLGAPLARMEAQIAVGMLLDYAPNLRLTVAPSEIRWNKGLMLRGLEALPVSF
jgi:cytochrome P450 PksS